MVKKEKPPLFDPARCEIHIIEFTNSVRQEINVFRNADDAVANMRAHVLQIGMYKYPARLRHIHVTHQHSYSAYLREIYTRECDDGPLIVDMPNTKVESPLSFADPLPKNEVK